MGLCGTDMIHHQNFLKEAENYRRYLIKTLNDKHAYGGSKKTGDWRWTVDSTFLNLLMIFPMIPCNREPNPTLCYRFYVFVNLEFYRDNYYQIQNK